uniref:RING-type domain-containing protein n=1 Tax=Helicotheca tamesis TaxID=374047 RepID=A0A7S2E3Q0_9STRA|mmetsp:Transcript_12257/g.16918  ORF Transcript_12257/g.16918 Transcript_12257/m.16918 type:complete len:209 (+) Transcript_12257:461-1087(+)
MCLKPARNGSNMHISFACIEEPKYLLNHCNGLMWYFKEPANAEYYFSNDSSWSLEPVETPETRVQRMPTMRREVSENSTGACPICFEPWGDEALKVVTECDHTICITCIVNICALRPPLTEGNCAQCRATVRLDNLNRVIDVDRVDQFSEGDIKTSDPSLEGNEHDSEEPAAVSEVSQVFTSNYQEILDSWEAGDWEESIRERSDRSY